MVTKLRPTSAALRKGCQRDAAIKLGQLGPDATTQLLFHRLHSLGKRRLTSLECSPLLRNKRIDVIPLVGPIDGGKDGMQAVIVLHRHRIELVIVALGTTDRHAVERADRGGDD